MPSNRKKKWGKKSEKRGNGGKEKSESQDCCVTFKPKNYLEILLSVHAQTLHSDILHLDQKAPKCKMYNRLCGKS